MEIPSSRRWLLRGVKVHNAKLLPTQVELTAIHGVEKYISKGDKYEGFEPKIITLYPVADLDKLRTKACKRKTLS